MTAPVSFSKEPFLAAQAVGNISFTPRVECIPLTNTANADFVMVWDSYISAGSPPTTKVYFRRYREDGTPVDPAPVEVIARAGVYNAVDAVCALENGEFIILVRNLAVSGGTSYSVSVRVDITGTQVSAIDLLTIPSGATWYHAALIKRSASEYLLFWATDSGGNRVSYCTRVSIGVPDSIISSPLILTSGYPYYRVATAPNSNILEFDNGTKFAIPYNAQTQSAPYGSNAGIIIVDKTSLTVLATIEFYNNDLTYGSTASLYPASHNGFYSIQHRNDYNFTELREYSSSYTQIGTTQSFDCYSRYQIFGSFGSYYFSTIGYVSPIGDYIDSINIISSVYRAPWARTTRTLVKRYANGTLDSITTEVNPYGFGNYTPNRNVPPHRIIKLTSGKLLTCGLSQPAFEVFTDNAYPTVPTASTVDLGTSSKILESTGQYGWTSAYELFPRGPNGCLVEYEAEPDGFTYEWGLRCYDSQKNQIGNTIDLNALLYDNIDNYNDFWRTMWTGLTSGGVVLIANVNNTKYSAILWDQQIEIEYDRKDFFEFSELSPNEPGYYFDVFPKKDGGFVVLPATNFSTGPGIYGLLAIFCDSCANKQSTVILEGLGGFVYNKRMVATANRVLIAWGSNGNNYGPLKFSIFTNTGSQIVAPITISSTASLIDVTTIQNGNYILRYIDQISSQDIRTYSSEIDSNGNILSTTRIAYVSSMVYYNLILPNGDWLSYSNYNSNYPLGGNSQYYKFDGPTGEFIIETEYNLPYNVGISEPVVMNDGRLAVVYDSDEFPVAPYATDSYLLYEDVTPLPDPAWTCGITGPTGPTGPVTTQFKQLMIAGVLNQPLGSFPMISQSDDGINWDEPTAPFDTNNAPTALTTDGETILVSNAKGYISITTDLQNFEVHEVSDGLGITDVGYKNGDWLAIGQRIYTNAYGPYPANSEVSQIYRAAAPEGPWVMAWSHPTVDSRLHQLKWFEYGMIGTWIACGEIDNRGDAWYSLDDGATWVQVPVPPNVKRIISVEIVTIGADEYIYWGCNGSIYRSTSFTDPNWTQLSIQSNDTITDMISHNGSLVVVGGNKIYTSQDGFYLRSWEYPGYTFNKIDHINNDGKTLWIAFAKSNLTQYTHWVTEDLVTWTPLSNNVHVDGHSTNPIS